jgi:hypothetical protein
MTTAPSAATERRHAHALKEQVDGKGQAQEKECSPPPQAHRAVIDGEDESDQHRHGRQERAVLDPEEEAQYDVSDHQGVNP